MRATGEVCCSVSENYIRPILIFRRPCRVLSDYLLLVASSSEANGEKNFITEKGPICAFGGIIEIYIFKAVNSEFKS